MYVLGVAYGYTYLSCFFCADDLDLGLGFIDVITLISYLKLELKFLSLHVQKNWGLKPNDVYVSLVLGRFLVCFFEVAESERKE